MFDIWSTGMLDISSTMEHRYVGYIEHHTHTHTHTHKQTHTHMSRDDEIDILVELAGHTSGL